MRAWTPGVVLIGAFGGLACDPAYPTATGQISLMSDVRSSDYAKVCVVSGPASAFELDGVLETGDAIASGGCASISQATFPMVYETRAGLGTSEIKQHRVVAWLGDEEPQVDDRNDIAYYQELLHGEGEWPIGHATFEASECGWFTSGYCGPTTHVAVTIDPTP